MAAALNGQREVILAVAGAYDEVLASIGKAANLEIARLEIELQRVSAAQEQPRRRPSWLTVVLAGLGGYWFGKQR
jgi:hypothetical protein